MDIVRRKLLLVNIYFQKCTGPWEREKLSFFHATTPFSQVWQILFRFDLAFCFLPTKPESMEQAKRNTKKWINNDKTSWLAKKFQDPVFCVFLLPSVLPCLNFGAFLSWWMSCPCVIILGFLNPLSPNIHIQILQTDLYTFPSRISWENLIIDQGIFP